MDFQTGFNEASYEDGILAINFIFFIRNTETTSNSFTFRTENEKFKVRSVSLGVQNSNMKDTNNRVQKLAIKLQGIGSLVS